MANQGPATPAAYGTYQERCSDVNNGMFDGDYAEVMHEFRLPRQLESHNPTATVTKRIPETIDVMPHHYIILMGELPDLAVSVMHLPSILHIPLGVTTRLPDNTTTAFISDVHHGIPPTLVYWPDKAMTPTTITNGSNIRVTECSICSR
jgi:hypothetical protein